MLFLEPLRLKQLLVLLFVLFFTISLIDCAYSQDEPQIEVIEGEEEIVLKFKKGDKPKSFELTLDEDSALFDAYVKIQALSLWDKERSKVISGELISFTLDDETDAKTGFTISKSNSRTINVTVNPEAIEPGSYSGKILITYGNSSARMNSDLTIPLKIQLGDTVYFALFLLFVGIAFGAFVNYVAKKTNNDSIINDIKNNPWPLLGGLLAIIGILLTTLILYYPRLVDFGADPLFDVGVTILFGFGQYGSGKISADVVNRVVNR